jgi:hypothetical protein
MNDEFDLSDGQGGPPKNQIDIHKSGM